MHQSITNECEKVNKIDLYIDVRHILRFLTLKIYIFYVIHFRIAWYTLYNILRARLSEGYKGGF